MREIFFRGKRNGEWIEGNSLTKGKYTFVGNEDSKGNVNFEEIDPETLGIWTGLTDKNGRKIFEGDIIIITPDYYYSDDYCISKVYVYNGVFCVDYHGDDFDSTALGFLDDYLPDGDFEIIGNIHDNPELLEVTK